VPSDYHDEYTKELQELIQRKLEGKVPAEKGPAPEPTRVRDLMSVLRESLAKDGPPAAAGNGRRRK
jgi:non-homologous end joining protein Ku